MMCDALNHFNNAYVGVCRDDLIAQLQIFGIYPQILYFCKVIKFVYNNILGYA